MSDEELVAELRQFHHDKAADRIEELLKERIEVWNQGEDAGRYNADADLWLEDNLMNPYLWTVLR